MLQGSESKVGNKETLSGGSEKTWSIYLSEEAFQGDSSSSWWIATKHKLLNNVFRRHSEKPSALIEQTRQEEEDSTCSIGSEEQKEKESENLSLLSILIALEHRACRFIEM